MHSSFLAVATLDLLLSLVSLQGQASGPMFVDLADKPKPSPGNVELASAEDVGKQTEAVIQAMSKETPKGLHLKSAVLTIQTGSAKEKSIELTFVVFTIAHKSKMTSTQTTTITFGDKELSTFSAEFAPPSIDEQFKKQLDIAIAAAEQDTVLKTKQISVKTEFVVTKETSGGLTFEVSGPFGVGKSAIKITPYDKTKVSTNSLELVYK